MKLLPVLVELPLDEEELLLVVGVAVAVDGVVGPLFMLWLLFIFKLFVAQIDIDVADVAAAAVAVATVTCSCFLRSFGQLVYSLAPSNAHVYAM